MHFTGDEQSLSNSLVLVLVFFITDNHLEFFNIGGLFKYFAVPEIVPPATLQTTG
jgi:hypothetical protein